MEQTDATEPVVHYTEQGDIASWCGNMGLDIHHTTVPESVMCETSRALMKINGVLPEHA